MKSSLTSSSVLNRSLLALVLGMMTLTACGGGSAGPTSPSTAGGATLNGSVVGTSNSTSSSAAGATPSSPSLSTPSHLVVSVENSTLSATVGTDGTFTFRGLPTGSFTLTFTRDGTRIGTLTFTSVLPDQELNITVSVNGSSVVLLQDARNGAGHGDLELEGNVEQVLLLNSVGDSRFMIASRVVVVRTGVTTIREGNTTRLPRDLTVGTHVHVKGTFLPAEGAVQPVLASEVKIQGGGAEGPTPTPAPTATPTPTSTPTPTPTPGVTCMIEDAAPGHNVDLEGRILSGNTAAFKLDAEEVANAVDVLAGTATLECSPKSGPNAPTPAQCSAMVKAGARVEVTGTLQTCTGSSALVSASKVTVHN